MRRFLLDTSAILFSVLESKRLTRAHRRSLSAGVLYVSQVSAMELAIKFDIGKLDLPEIFEADFAAGFSSMVSHLDAEIMNPSLADIARLARLPLVHRDPFDRLILCQALGADMTLVTADRTFSSYAGVDVMEI